MALFFSFFFLEREREREENQFVIIPAKILIAKVGSVTCVILRVHLHRKYITRSHFKNSDSFLLNIESCNHLARAKSDSTNICKQNWCFKILTQLIKELLTISLIYFSLTGLSHVTQCPQTMGLFNGEDYVFTSSSVPLIDFGKLFMRYGWDVYRLQKVPASVLQDFMK